MTARCPAGHESSELDYCSVCGASMGVAATSGAARAAPPAFPGLTPSGCPSCGEPRTDLGARFCEVCRYDYIAQKLGPAPRAAAAPPAPPAPVAPAAAAAAAAPPAAAHPPSVAPPPSTARAVDYSLVVQVDASLDVDPGAGPPCPTGVADAIFAFDKPEILVGRKDDLRDVHPDIPLADPGTSRRHAKFVRTVDGALAFVDLASTNGSKLNGVEVAAGSRSTLHAGDEVTLGRWTRIRVAVRP